MGASFLCLCLLFCLGPPLAGAAQPHSANPRFDRTSRNGVADNQPVGNGEVVANVWAENGTLALLLGRSDVFSGFVQPLKLGRVLLSFQPDPFAASVGGAADYSQVLDLESATVRCTVTSADGEAVEISIWSDINSVGQADSIRVEVQGLRHHFWTISHVVFHHPDKPNPAPCAVLCWAIMLIRCWVVLAI